MPNPFRPSQQVERQKTLALVAAGVVVGGGLTVAVGAWLPGIGGAVLACGGLVGALAGAAFARTLAPLLDTGPWAPVSAGRSYVGTHAPDEIG